MGIFTFLKEIIRSEDQEPPDDAQLLQAIQLRQISLPELEAEKKAEIDAQVLRYAKDADLPQCFKLAAQYIENGQYNAAIYMYRRMADLHPEVRQDCEGQIGIAHYCKGNYRKAIESYIAARVHGADAAWMDENIWEACETQMRQETDPVRMREPLNLYLTLCPKGEYRAQAQEYLEKLRPVRAEAALSDTDEL
jgi:tetratricopeptide (TPR) repeat protein